MRWATEPWLAMGRSSGAEEWLELVDVEHRPALPLPVTALSGWFGVGNWVLPLALILSGDDDSLVLMTTPDFGLVRTDRRTAREHAEKVAAAMRMRLTEPRL